MEQALPWTIVYVDDEQYNLDELRDALEPRLANPIKLFTQAQEFMTWVSSTRERISAILVDFIMPDMNGLELIRWCKDNRPDLKPLIVVTGMQDKYSQDQARDAGADAYLIKPVSLGTLLSALTELEHHQFEVKNVTTEAPPAADVVVAPLVVKRRHAR